MHFRDPEDFALFLVATGLIGLGVLLLIPARLRVYPAVSTIAGIMISVGLLLSGAALLE